jgi:hypothetical protein
MPKPDYDTTLARIAGNIAGHILASAPGGSAAGSEIAFEAVLIARAIVAEIKRTEPETAQATATQRDVLCELADLWRLEANELAEVDERDVALRLKEAAGELLDVLRTEPREESK